LATGVAHSCLIESGSISCWGYGADGERGDGTLTAYNPLPQPVVGLTDQVVISAGAKNTCSVGADGNVFCWGDNSEGQVGNGSTGGVFSTPQRVVWSSVYGPQRLINIVEVSVGPGSACALDTGRQVWCWGAGKNAAQRVQSVTALQVTSHCVLNSDRTVSCWQGSALQRVPFLTNAVEISSAGYSLWPAQDYNFDCARLADGTIKCWGENVFGDLGNGKDGLSSDGNLYYKQYNWLPTHVVSPDGRTNLTQVVALSHSNASNTMCANTADGASYCWGYNDWRATGTGFSKDTIDFPSLLGDLNGSPAVEVAMGLSFGCAITVDGALWCWGNNYYGEFGNGEAQGAGVAPLPIWIRSIQ
jgi:alpha-tubulin suppressor-like RCC1 family protein